MRAGSSRSSSCSASWRPIPRDGPDPLRPAAALRARSRAARGRPGRGPALGPLAPRVRLAAVPVHPRRAARAAAAAARPCGRASARLRGARWPRRGARRGVAALPPRQHALPGRAGRALRLRRHLRRGRVRLGRDGTRPVRHPAHDLRHARRRSSGGIARRPPRRPSGDPGLARRAVRSSASAILSLGRDHVLFVVATGRPRRARPLRQRAGTRLPGLGLLIGAVAGPLQASSRSLSRPPRAAEARRAAISACSPLSGKAHLVRRPRSRSRWRRRSPAPRRRARRS